MRMPRLLIINAQSLYENNATGITLRSIVSHYPKCNLIETCFYANQLVPYNKVKIKSFRFSPWSRPVNHVVRDIFGAVISEKINKSIINDQIQENNSRINRKELFKVLVRGFLDLIPTWYEKKTLCEIDRFKPEVIYTMGASVYVLQAALFFSRRYNCKIILHYMDNWRECLFAGNKILSFYKNILSYYIRKVEDRMNVGLTISDSMAEYYSNASGKEYHALMNLISPEKIRVPKLNNNQKLIITYTGGLHLNRYKSLLGVEYCIGMLNKEGIDTALHIYCKNIDRNKYEVLFDKNITIFKCFLPHDRVYEAYDQADVLLHIESFDPEQIYFTKYSLSTKISEYLSAGKPILCYSPQGLAVYDYIKKSNAGFSVCTPAQLNTELRALANDPALRLQLAKNGVNVAKKRHALPQAYDQFKHAICKSL